MTKIKCITLRKQRNSEERKKSKCKNCGRYFQESYLNNGAKPETKRMIISISVNGSGDKGFVKEIL